jgi:acetoin:2,6-dichlorophenolindophenol oxidoreductase subunit alpha
MTNNGAASRLLSMYATMHRIRIFEETLSELVEAGEIKTPCHLYIGQEAVATGVCTALEPTDTVWGGHRSHGHYLAKGGDLNALMAEIFGKPTGCSGGRGGSMHLYDESVGVLGTVPLVAATIPLSVGAGLAYKLRKDGHVAVAFFGDGATEEGSFHESLNMAALYKLPVIFVCENNLYASHLHITERRAKDNIVESGAAHGIASFVVDGNDAEAVFATAESAVQRARRGEGPTLIEARTFRWRGHVGPSWDMDVGVLRKDTLKEWIPKDPIARAHRELLARGFSDDELKEVESRARIEVKASVEPARSAPWPDPDTLHDHVFVA